MKSPMIDPVNNPPEWVVRGVISLLGLAGIIVLNPKIIGIAGKIGRVAFILIKGEMSLVQPLFWLGLIGMVTVWMAALFALKRM